MANKKSAKSAAGRPDAGAGNTAAAGGAGAGAGRKGAGEERAGTKIEARKGKRGGKAVTPPDNKRGGGV